jgi:hypothetical protein
LFITMQVHSTTLKLPRHLQSLAELAALLERVERQGPRPDAAQYRELSQRLSQLLAQTPPSADLDRLLAVAPATAELYENLHYARAGLCRSPLERATEAELQTRQLLQRLHP